MIQPTKTGVVLLFALALTTCNTNPSYASKSTGFVFKPIPSIDLVAMTGNNARQETRKLLKPVQHRTIADVFLCLSFVNLLVMGELRLALVRLWWGGRGNKSFIRRIPCAVVLRFSSLPTALILGQSSKNTPLEKV